MSGKINALVLNKADSVAVAIDELKAGDVAQFKVGEEVQEIEIIENVPVYHKFSIKGLHENDLVYKYGQVIGKAMKDVQVGQHVHSHNLISIREGIGEV